MNDADYAVDIARRRECIAAIIVVVIGTIFAYYVKDLRWAVRSTIACILPLACIWFPDAMSRFKGPAPGQSYFATEASHPKIIRFASWFFIVLIPFGGTLLFILRD
jgi:hypothetical protein